MDGITKVNDLITNTGAKAIDVTYINRLPPRLTTAMSLFVTQLTKKTVNN